MVKQNERGEVNGLLVSLILSVLLLIIAVVIAGWALASRSDYKNNSDKKVAIAVTNAKTQQSAIKDKQFAEDSKNPLKIYNGPEAYGSISLSFPKTWSGYVATSGSGLPVDGYFSPLIVPTVGDRNNSFALRLVVSNQSYSEIMKSLETQQKAGKLTVSAYSLPKMPRTVGAKVVGQKDGKNVTMVVMPLRSQAIQLWTEGDQYINDFNTYILPNFSFSP